MSRPFLLIKAAETLVRFVPLRISVPLSERLGRFWASRFPKKTGYLRENYARVVPDASPEELDRLVAKGYGSYARYWVESLKMPHVSSNATDAGFSVAGFENIEETLSAGYGPILALPHLGGWEWGAAWLYREKNMHVSAVVERVKPDDVFNWFIKLRQSYGIEVIPLGKGSMGALQKAVKKQNIVCLLCDRDLAGNGIAVEFFGEKTTFPVGPVVLSKRTGAPILPTAVFFDGAKRHCIVGEPIWPDKNVSVKDSMQDTMQLVAVAFEELIRKAPEQWHVTSRVW